MDRYKRFENEIKNSIKVISNELLLHAKGVDASCYDYTPKLIVKPKNEDDIKKIFSLANELETPLTFRASGTSLSGQCSSDSVLVVIDEGWDKISINADASIIECECGVIGQKANEALAKHGKKIGPDPATIATARIGGMLNNNSSGMCCGVAQNSYNTISSLRVIFADGAVLDTSDDESVREFASTHNQLFKRVLELSSHIKSDDELCELIKSKFKIKNTTGYSINALCDFSEFKDILNHILIGSEGTLGFISKVRYKTVADARLKACALLFYSDLAEASKAVVALNALGAVVSSAEMMDGSCLKALKSLDGMSEMLYNCDENDICLLIQNEAHSKDELDKNLEIIKNELAKTQMSRPALYSFDKAEQEQWWKLRKSILPIVAGFRPAGSTVITEDVCFKITDFIAGTALIKELFAKYGFDDGVIFGHALSGNLHFNITPNLSNKDELERFSALLNELCDKVAKMGGSLKAEHGTGRMVAPFVELEWGEKAYEINKQIKEIFDPKGILNPDVIISQNKQIYKQKLKLTPEKINLLPSYSQIINKCMECGFCAKVCPSANLSLSPRERISALRYISLLELKGEHEKMSQMLSEYEYYGIKTCAKCSSCEVVCPLSIDTAKIADELLEIRAKSDAFGRKKAQFLAKNMGLFCAISKAGLVLYSVLASIFGKENISKLSAFLKTKIPALPFVPSKMPKANFYALKNRGGYENKIIYFSTCTNRIFSEKVAVQKSFESICAKAKISVIYPKNIKNMCCGKLYSEHKDLFENNINSLNKELLEISQNGAYPVVLDHSSCFVTLSLASLDSRLKILDISEFLLSILPLLDVEKTQKSLLVHQLCRLRKIGKEENIITLAKALSDDVRQISSFTCCGFAGNKGFSTPELNICATKDLKNEHADMGVSSSNTCQIGLSSYGACDFYSIAYLLDLCSKQKN